MAERTIGFAEYHVHIVPLSQIPAIVFLRPFRGGGHHKVIIRMGGMPLVGKVHEDGHHVADLKSPGTGQEGNPELVRKTRAGKESRPTLLHGRALVDGIHQGVPLIDKGNALCLEIRLFEGENDEEPVHIGLKLADTAFPAGPHFRSYVIIDLEAGFMGKFGYAEIETGVIYENDHVRLPAEDVLLAAADVL